VKGMRLIDANALLDQNNWTVKQYSEEEADAWRDGIDLMKKNIENAPTIGSKTLRPVAHWEEIPGSYVSCAGENAWCVPATRCSNPECGEVNPCGLKTPFCPMCGFRMEDVPYDAD
jgi:hypothetical protein